jgi:hypothetical protein
MDSIDFLCINCQEMVTKENISMHSLICVYPLPNILKLECESIASQIIYKLNKIAFALQSRIADKLPEIDRGIYEFLITQANTLLTVQDPSRDSLEKCKSTAFTLDRYSTTVLSPGLILYCERLKVLASQAIKTLEQELSSQINPLDLKYKEIQEAKENIYKGITENSHNIDEISSQISQIWNHKPGSTIFTSPDEFNIKDLEELDKLGKIQEKEQEKKNSEDLKKYFFSICLLKKLSFPSEDPVQRIQIPDLYKKVLELQVHVNDWKNYITEQFENPERWLDGT